MYSEILNMRVPLKLSCHALRTLDKHGGLDEVIKKMKVRKMSPEILALKRDIRKKEKALALS